MIRFRDIAPLTHHLPTGEKNAITDVEGVKVGQVTLIEGEGKLIRGQSPIRTGITAILPHDGNLFLDKVPAAVHTINGYGKACGFEQVRELGVIETPILLTNTLNIPRVADGLISYMIQQNPDIGVGSIGTVNPLVGECNDGFLNDIQGRHMREEHVFQAIESATNGTIVEGCVGAATGTQCYQFKGGIGTASRKVGDFTVGVLLQTNFGKREELSILGVPVGLEMLSENLPKLGGGSVMVIIATDAPLDARQLGRLTHRVAFGLGRTGTVCHDGSGDFSIAFSTANTLKFPQVSTLETTQRFTERSEEMDMLFRSVVECVEESVYNALIAAETMTGRDGNTLYALPHDRLREILQKYGRSVS